MCDKYNNQSNPLNEKIADTTRTQNCNLGENELGEDINQNITLNEDQLGKIAAGAGESKKKKRKLAEELLQKIGDIRHCLTEYGIRPPIIWPLKRAPGRDTSEGDTSEGGASEEDENNAR